MISDIQPCYRNCPSCGKKVSYYGKDSVEALMNQLRNTPLSHCPNCGVPFPLENTRMIQKVIAYCRQRVAQPQDPTRVCYSTFYPAFSPAGNVPCKVYNHIYSIPLFSIEELLVLENLLHHGNYRAYTGYWVAGFREGDQPPMTRSICGLPTYDGPMQLLSWHPLLWDKEEELFFVGPDEGPRTVTWTPFEKGEPISRNEALSSI